MSVIYLFMIIVTFLFVAKCPDFNCGLDCLREGYKIDEKGCRLCECASPLPCPALACQPCPSGSYYKKGSDGCMTCDCDQKPPECPQLTCGCPPGYKHVKINDCPTCGCERKNNYAFNISKY